MERIGTQIDIKLNGSREIVKAKTSVKGLADVIEKTNLGLKASLKSTDAVARSVNALNGVLSTAKTNFNNVALGTNDAKIAAEQYLKSLKDTNAALAEQKAAVISLQNARRSEASFLASGARAGRGNAIADADSQAQSVAIARARNLELQAAMANQELARQVATRAPRLPAFQERGLERLEDEFKAKKELVGLEEAADKASRRRLNVQKRQSQETERQQKLGIGINKNEKLINASYEDRVKFAKRNGEIRRQALIRANNLVLAEQKINQQQAARGGRTLGQGLKGGLSNALIGGGFPLLFGQGPAAAIGGGLGGLAGGMIGGGFGFALSIVGTAIGQAVAESNKFNKSLTTLNNRLQAVGGTSRITARDIGEIRKSIGATKDETLQLVSSLSRFGPGATDIAKSLGPDASNIITTLASINEEELSTEKALQKLTSSIGNEKALQLASELKGLSVEEKRLKILKEIQLIEAKTRLSDREFKAFTGQLGGGRSTQSLRKRAKAEVGDLTSIQLGGFVSQEADVLGLTNKPKQGKGFGDSFFKNVDNQILKTRIELIKTGGTLLDEERVTLEKQLIAQTAKLELAKADGDVQKQATIEQDKKNKLSILDAQVAAAQTEEDKRRNEIITNTMDKLEGESQFLEESLSLGVEKAEIEKQIRDIVAIVGDEREGEVRSLVEGNAEQRKKLQLLAEEKAMQQQIQGILAGGMTNAVMGLIDGTKTLGQALADIAKQLASMFLNKAFMSIFSSFGGGGGGGALPPSPIYVAAQGGFSRSGGFKAFQSGGVVNSPTMGMVGEGGESEYIIPASKMSGAMSRYSAGARGGSVIPGGSGDSGTVAGGTGNTIVEYTGPVLNFNGDEYVPKSAVPEIINTAAKRGGEAGQARAFATLKNSRSQRATLGL